MKRLCLLGVLVLGGCGHAGGQVFQSVESVCCKGAFTLDNLLDEVKLPRAAPGKVQLMVVREQAPRGRDHSAVTDPPFRYYRSLILEESDEMPGVAYVAQSGEGASAVLWRPRTGFYETRRLWGKDVLRLDDGSDIVAMGPGLAGLSGPDLVAVRVWVWVKRRLDEATALKLTTAVTQRLAVARVQVILAPHPYMWGTGGFPLVVPAFGLLGKNGILEAQPRPFFVCRGVDILRAPPCYRVGKALEADQGGTGAEQ